jgi:CRP-like cAMP-binding protein
MSTTATVERLRGVPLFAGLDADVLERVAATATEVELPQGTVLVEERTKGSGCFLIEEGRVTVDARAGHFELGPGEVVGELALLTDAGVRTARVRAETPLRCLAISRADFAALLESEPRLALGLLEVVAGRLAAAMTSH